MSESMLPIEVAVRRSLSLHTRAFTSNSIGSQMRHTILFLPILSIALIYLT